MPTILIAEDEPTNRDLLEAHLQRKNYKVVVTENGKEAVEAAQRQTFDAILLDISMPVMGGIEAARHIHTSPSVNIKTPIAFITAYQTEHHRTNTGSLPADKIFRKPVNWPALFVWLSEHIRIPIEEADTPDVDLLRTDIINQLISALPIETVERLFNRFQEDLDQRIPRLEQAIINRQQQDIVALSHAICGIASAFGANALEQAARDIHDSPDAVISTPDTSGLEKLLALKQTSVRKLGQIIALNHSEN